MAGAGNILITGFEPFAGDRRNPSEYVARALNEKTISGRRVVGAVLPCEFGKSLRVLRALLRKHRPAAVICVGVANDRADVTPERVAINLDDARIADNAGRQPRDRGIVRGGPTAYWSTLPIKKIAAAMNRRGIPASVSQTAGTFVCNHVFYGLMHELRRTARVRGGFIHVPWPSDWGEKKGSSILSATLVDAIELAARETSRTRS